MKNGKIYVAGIGPGCEDDITPAVKKRCRYRMSWSDITIIFLLYSPLSWKGQSVSIPG